MDDDDYLDVEWRRIQTQYQSKTVEISGTFEELEIREKNNGCVIRGSRRTLITNTRTNGKAI